MTLRIIGTVLLFCALASQAFGQQDAYDKYAEAAMRKIGHEVLLLAGDNTSRVLPIERVENKYTIRFDTHFTFDPEQLRGIVDPLLQTRKIAKQYIVEVINCDSSEIVYNYVIFSSPDSLDGMVCQGRLLPLDCYSILITIVERDDPTSVMRDDTSSTPPIEASSESFWLRTSLITIFIVSMGIWLWRRAQRNEQDTDHLITLGSYSFNQRNLQLTMGENSVELTSKEANLLVLLHGALNDTVERDVILKEVWDDEGDYIGRTLDVYISKLRKHLQGDERIKIMNVRGVGYKLLVDE